MNLENANLEDVVKEDYFPDPDFYFLALSNAENKESSINNADYKSFLENEIKYRSIKDVEQIYGENRKLTKKIDEIIIKKRHHSANKIFTIPDNHMKKDKRKKLEINRQKNLSNRNKSLIFCDEDDPIFLNQLSFSSILSHKWRCQSSRANILRMKPEFSHKNFDNGISIFL